MAEFLSPGIYIEEVPAQLQVVSGVSTSNMGIIGFTKRGPSNKATLVTSYEEFTRVFGGLTHDSFLPIEMAAYFANGGRRAYVVRVTPGDATSADADIGCKSYDQGMGTGDGILTAFSGVIGASLRPIRPNSVSFRWRELGAAAVAENMMLRDGTSPALGKGAAPPATDVYYEIRVNPANLPGAYGAAPEFELLDPKQYAIAPVAASVTITWTSGANPYPGAVLPIPAAGVDDVTYTTPPVVGPPAFPGGSVIKFSYRTGIATIVFAAGEEPDAATNIQIAYTKTTATKTATDNGAGVLIGDVGGGPNTIDYSTGAWAITMAAAPHNRAPILSGFQTNAWDLDPASAGSWADDSGAYTGLKIRVRGNVDYYDAPTATYSKFDVFVYLKNETSGAYEVVESYEALDFVSPTDTQYLPDVINELSDYLTVTTPGGNLPVRQLSGRQYSMIIGGGDGTTGNKLFTFGVAPADRGVFLPPSFLPSARTLRITYTDSTGAARLITDDGAGNLTGDVVAGGTINYTTGELKFSTSQLILQNTFVTASWYSVPDETTHDEVFTGGTDGTFTDPAQWGRNQFTSPTLKTPYEGMYALNRVDEVMQVIIPDFAGDVTITGDMLDYADERAALPQGGDRYIILTVPVGSSAQEAVDWLRYDLARYSKFAALYWPWIKVADPLADNRPMLVPPVAHIAGVYARTDYTRNVGKAPGGTVDGKLNFLLGLEVDPSQGDRDLVYQNRINPLINTPQTGMCVWGVRQIALESEWRYINARRLFMFLEKSIYNSTAWIVFEGNGAALWSKIKLQIISFLSNLFSEGYFAGASPSQAFFVICDETNNSQATIDAGQVIIDVGVAPNKPAEFVRFRFTQKTLT